jgi:23S rRNA (cytosine1962-C5)-methyltransferase
MRALAGEGARFDLVICDPPAFAPRKDTLDAGLRAYERTTRLALPLVAEGGMLVLCSCSHAVTPDALMGSAQRMFHRARRTARLVHSGRAGPDHPVHPALAESGYLKVLVFAMD